MVGMKSWDDKYAADRYYYGTEPNELVRACLLYTSDAADE